MFEQSLKCRGRFCSHHFETSLSHDPGVARFFIPESRPHFAPDRKVDVEHLFLDLEVDLKQKSLSGTCKTFFTAVSPHVEKLKFDAVDLKVEKVVDQNGKPVLFSQSEKAVLVSFGQPLTAGSKGELTFHYSVVQPRAGLYFIAPDDDYPSRPYQLWTQGQDQDNRYWIPCHDSPNEKATTEMRVTVKEGLTAVSNGKLLSHEKKNGKSVFHYKLSIPHASYLITLCIGEFVEITEKWKNQKGQEIPVQYFTLKGREEETKFAFGQTVKMLDFFSKKTGFDYPYEKYAQVVAWDFIYGGMENTSSTTQTEYTLHPKELELDYSSEPLVAHELAHQWFGDWLTCKDWSHAWLNEGFATYFESLWTEHEHGKDEFLMELYVNENIYKDEDQGAYRRPIVTNQFLSPSDIFDRHLYEKGGRVLHMLRKFVGEDLWWKAIRKYVENHREGTVETVDLQRVFEDVSGLSLSWFFDQWVFKAGHPEVKAVVAYDEEKKKLRLDLTQGQKKTEMTGLFRLPIEFKIADSKGEKTHAFMFDTVQESVWFDCAEKPKYVSLNPENPLLLALDFDCSQDWFIAQLSHDPDIMGRMYAAKKLTKDHSRTAVEALCKALREEKFWGVQAEIAACLGKIGSDLAKETLFELAPTLKHPRARKVAYQALGSFREKKWISFFKKALEQDPSPLVQFEAAKALGKTKSNEALEILKKSLFKIESWHAYADRGIVYGLSEFRHDSDVLQQILEATKLGQDIFLRRDAVVALAKAASHNPSLVMEDLLHLLKDKNFFVKVFTIDALSMLGDERAASALKYISDISVEPRTHRAALLASKAVRDGKNPSEEAEKLKASLDKVEEKYKELLSRIEKLEKK